MTQNLIIRKELHIQYQALEDLPIPIYNIFVEQAAGFFKKLGANYLPRKRFRLHSAPCTVLNAQCDTKNITYR